MSSGKSRGVEYTRTGSGRCPHVGVFNDAPDCRGRARLGAAGARLRPPLVLSVVHDVLMSPVALRSAFLSSGLRPSLFLRGAPSFRQSSSWAGPSRVSSHFFTRTAAPRPLFSRKLLWAIPVAGGFALYALPTRREPHNVFASPDLIPCSASREPLETVIMSPSESDRTLSARIFTFIRERILEPILTAQRFIYLCCIFVPVLLATPMLLIGPPEAGLGGDRWGAVWWYGFLTSQMQRAGPTFIKVSPDICTTSRRDTPISLRLAAPVNLLKL